MGEEEKQMIIHNCKLKILDIQGVSNSVCDGCTAYPFDERDKTPLCKTCGKLMLEWNTWADEHEHVECIAERISTSLIEIVKKYMKLN